MTVVDSDAPTGAIPRQDGRHAKPTLRERAHARWPGLQDLMGIDWLLGSLYVICQVYASVMIVLLSLWAGLSGYLAGVPAVVVDGSMIALAVLATKPGLPRWVRAVSGVLMFVCWLGSNLATFVYAEVTAPPGADPTRLVTFHVLSGAPTALVLVILVMRLLVKAHFAEQREQARIARETAEQDRQDRELAEQRAREERADAERREEARLEREERQERERADRDAQERREAWEHEERLAAQRAREAAAVARDTGVANRPPARKPASPAPAAATSDPGDGLTQPKRGRKRALEVILETGAVPTGPAVDDLALAAKGSNTGKNVLRKLEADGAVTAAGPGGTREPHLERCRDLLATEFPGSTPAPTPLRSTG